MTLSLFISVCELNTLLCWPELRVLNSPELFTPCEKLLHFYKLFIYLFTLVPPLPVLFCSSSFDPFVIFLPPFFLFFFYITLFYLSIHFLAGIWLAGLKGVVVWMGASRVICIICGVALVHRHQREMVANQSKVNWTLLASSEISDTNRLYSSRVHRGFGWHISANFSGSHSEHCVRLVRNGASLIVILTRQRTNAYMFTRTVSAHTSTTRPKLNWRTFWSTRRNFVF